MSGQVEVYGPGFVYENGADDPRGHREVEEITFGYLLGLVEIVNSPAGSGEPTGKLPPSTLTLFLLNSFFS
jgi:hypothetical protein